MMLSSPKFCPGACIDIIAPSSDCTPAEVENVRQTFLHWGLTPRIPKGIFGQDLLCANTDSERFQQLITALYAPDSIAVWCLRGGYGTTRLLPELMKQPSPPPMTKLLIGFSDITAFHIFLQQQWGWKTLHGPTARQIGVGLLPADDIEDLRLLLFGQKNGVEFDQLIPLNASARQKNVLSAPVTGGNLSLIQRSIGTGWQIQPQGKILLLEDVNERGYEVDRMLEHLRDAGLLKGLSAILFGDFTGGLEEKDRISLVDPVLSRFAETCSYPVLRCFGIGHGSFNYPMPLGTRAELFLEEDTARLWVETPLI